MFYDELEKTIGLPIAETFKDYKIINTAGKSLYIQNYQKLLVYQPNNIVLKVKNNELIIEGQSLKIAELNKDSVLIKGKVYKTYLAKEIDK